YVGNKGSHVFAGNGPAYDLNPIPLGAGTAVMTANGVQFKPVIPAEQRRQFFNHFNVDGILCCGDGIMGNYFGNDASSNYNALQVRLDKRFSQGLQFMSTYTYSHANNWTTDGNFPYGSVADRRLGYGPDDFNRKNVWITNFVYDLPFGRGKKFAGGAGKALDLIIGGWQLTDTFNKSSGLPWTPTLGECGLVNDTSIPCMPNVSGSFHM